MGSRYTPKERYVTYWAMWKTAQSSDGPNLRGVGELLGIPVRTLHDWWKAGAPSDFEPKGAPAATEPARIAREWAADLLQMTPEKKQLELVAQLFELREWAILKDAATAAASLTVQLTKVIADMLPKEGVLIEGPEGLPEEEYREWLRQHAQDNVDDIDIEVLMQVYAERHRGRVVFIGEGGHRAELDETGKWKRTGKVK